MTKKELIIVPVMYYIDDETGKRHFDFEGMAEQFEKELSELDNSVDVTISVETL